MSCLAFKLQSVVIWLMALPMQLNLRKDVIKHDCLHLTETFFAFFYWFHRVGGRENFFHCPKCDMCLSTSLLNSHKVFWYVCCKCVEYLFGISYALHELSWLDGVSFVKVLFFLNTTIYIALYVLRILQGCIIVWCPSTCNSNTVCWELITVQFLSRRQGLLSLAQSLHHHHDLFAPKYCSLIINST